MKKKRPLISVIIPVYNEEKTIGEVVERTEKALAGLGISHEVLVVDDCSFDRSAKISLEMKARVLKQKKHHGKGYILNLGFKEALGEFIITLDSDGSHQPEEIGILLDPLMRDEADFVIGSRFLGNNPRKTKIPKINSIGLKFFNSLIKILTGLPTTDSQSGFRAIKASIVKTIDLKSVGYEVESEMLVKAVKIPCRIMEVPITFQQRTMGKSKLDPVKDGIKIFSSILESYLF